MFTLKTKETEMKRINAASIAIKCFATFVALMFLFACTDPTGGTDPTIIDEEDVAEAKAILDAGDFTFTAGDSSTSVTDDLSLPLSGSDDTTIAWSEITDPGNNVSISGAAVTVSRPSSGSGDATVVVRATIAKGSASDTKDLSLTIIQELTDAEAVALAKANLDAADFTFTAGDSSTSVTDDLSLPLSGSDGTTIAWSEITDTGNNVVISGGAVTVTRPSNGSGNKTVVVRATITKGGASDTKDLSLVIIEAPVTYTVTYNGNLSTGGSVPTDSTGYEQGETVTVLGNTGSLVKAVGAISVLFTGWDTAAGGDGTHYDASDTFDVGTQDVTLYAQFSSSVLGGTGPAGGLVFYDKGSFTDGWQYLEAAPSNQGRVKWIEGGSLQTTSLVGSTSQAIGTGQANSDTIVAQTDHTASAAKICLDYVLNGFDDWFLPARNTLDQMYNNLHLQGLGAFIGTQWNPGQFFSSTESSANNVMVVQFTDQNRNTAYFAGSTLKDADNWVRPVRDF